MGRAQYGCPVSRFNDLMIEQRDGGFFTKRYFDEVCRHCIDDPYVDGRHEASNGQLRSFLEALLLGLSEGVPGRRPGSSMGAIDRLRNAGAIDGDQAELLKGIVGVSNDRGAHSGLTETEEALFRLHIASSVARYLLARVQ